jgi:hypothetical protein
MNAPAGIFAVLIFSFAIFISCTAANAGGGHPVGTHGGRCYQNCWHQTQPVTGTNKQTCKPNGEGCLRPK